MAKILNIGSLNLDYVYAVPHFVEAGETLLSGRRDVFAGGKGLNQTVAAARAGAKVCHGGAVGADGEMLLDLLREAGAEIVVVCAHWGLEGSYSPTADQRSVGRAAIDAGADIVCGSHPHVLQPMEGYAGGVILYSLGNWSFGGNTAPQDRDTAIVQLRFRRDPDGSLTLDECTAVPCSVSGSTGRNDYQPTPYARDSEGYARVIHKLNGSFTGEDLTVDYSALE